MTAERDISISEAARLMQMMGIGSLILVDASKTPDAIVTDRDLVAKIGTGIDPRATPVGECASKPLITIRVDSDTVEAVALMKKHGIRRIPLVDEAGALTGMVTMDDVLVQLGTDGGEMLANLAEVIGAGARKEHPRSSAHDRSL
jgi:signal-transduction protein with cAMP-binding, CBS, and nucleotidyltransferase domain